MGQRFVPELHDPDKRNGASRGEEDLSDAEVRRKFNAIVAELDEQDHQNPVPDQPASPRTVLSFLGLD